MRYSELIDVYEKLEATSKKLEKRDILADFYRHSRDDIYQNVVLSMGQVFPQGDLELGLAGGLVKKIISKVTGASDSEVIDAFKKTGDLGSAAELLISKRKQKTLGGKELTISHVFENLRKLPDLAGSGSQEKKIGLVAELLTSAKPREARYIVRTALGQMRIGVAAGIVRDALAKAFDKNSREIEKIYNIVGDYGRIAEGLKSGKLAAEIEIFRPMNVMLADRGDDLKSAMELYENTALEVKYDGFRIIGHKNGDKVRVFSRRLEDVTHQFPDIASWIKNQIKAKTCIIDGEALAFNKKTGEPMPFQQLSRRIQRKYDIEEMVRDIPVQVNLFDIIYINGASLMDRPLRERWAALNKIVSSTKNFRLAEHLETKDFEKAEKFYRNALAMGQEGVIVKNMDASYQPGRRVGFWVKIKPILEPLDLVVVGAEWGEGKRGKWLSSMILAAKQGSKLLETGRMASGFTEQQLEELTKKLKGLITGEEGKIVKVKPEVVVEIGYEEIQKSAKYASGYALRFPRLLRIRDSSEKGPNDADTVKTIEKLFNMQRGRKK